MTRPVSDLTADLGDLLLAEGGHGPVAAAAGDAPHEALQQPAALGRMHHLGMEHEAVIAPCVVGDDGERRPLAHPHGAEAGGQLGHPVAMAHPDLLAAALLPDAVEQRAILDHLDEGAAVLAIIRWLDLAAELGAEGLMAVADAEQRHAHLEGDLRRPGRPHLGHRGGPAGEDDGLGRELGDLLRVGVEGHDLAIDARLADAPRDQLRDLAAEIENQNTVRHEARIIQFSPFGSKPGSGPRCRASHRPSRGR